MFRHIKKQLKRTFYFYELYLFIRNYILWVRWVLFSRPVPPPHIVKQRCVLDYARRYNMHVFVETGTFQGEMVRAVRSAFEKIYTIEFGNVLAEDAKRLFMPFPHIHVIQGDSAIALHDLLIQLREPCLFWLDAHYSGEGTAIADAMTPVLSELDCILSHSMRSHVILIDDARCFDGKGDYPSLPEIRIYINDRRPDLAFEVRDDIIRITMKT